MYILNNLPACSEKNIAALIWYGTFWSIFHTPAEQKMFQMCLSVLYIYEKKRLN